MREWLEDLKDGAALIALILVVGFAAAGVWQSCSDPRKPAFAPARGENC